MSGVVLLFSQDNEFGKMTLGKMKFGKTAFGKNS